MFIKVTSFYHITSIKINVFTNCILYVKLGSDQISTEVGCVFDHSFTEVMLESLSIIEKKRQSIN